MSRRNQVPLVVIDRVHKHFETKRGLLHAANGVSFTIYQGETLGLVGESGCGKSTIGKLLASLLTPSDGKIYFDECNINEMNKKERKKLRRRIQMIFQDPYSSLNPRMTAEEIIAEPLWIHDVGAKPERPLRVAHLIDLVGLPRNALKRYPHEFSGGQRQRIGIARALALNPWLLICDEPVSALDVSIQAQILELLKNLQKELKLTYLFIAHDLSVVRYISDRIAVMYLGQIAEIAPTEQLFKAPSHPYTQALLSAVPVPDPIIERSKNRAVLQGDPPSPINLPQGCLFCSRCPQAQFKCQGKRPQLYAVEPGHLAACHLLEPSELILKE